MAAAFASQEWVDRFAQALEGSARVRTESTSWVFGPLLLVVDADAEHGVGTTGIRLDLHEGSVSGVRLADVAASVTRTPFVVEGSLARWKAVFAGQLPLVQGVLDSRLRVTGDLPTLARHRALLDAIAAAGGQVETSWQDEQAAEPARA
jgi:putative sterol carrier protein